MGLPTPNTQAQDCYFVEDQLSRGNCDDDAFSWIEGPAVELGFSVFRDHVSSGFADLPEELVFVYF